MQLVDTHCHIQSIGQKTGERHTQELWAKAKISVEDVITRAKEGGVDKLICVGCDFEDSLLAIDFVSEHTNTWASIGIHPHEARAFVANISQQSEFAALATRKKVVAIGECGLDYFYEHSPKKDQIEVLKLQLELALSNNLPVIFHVREAFSDFWPVLDNYPGIRGVLHSFTDNLANLEEGLKRGLMFGVNGIATFAKKPEQVEVYKAIPLSNLLLETDSPFLTPVPFRGNINEPNMVGVIAKYMAELRNEDIRDLATATTANATKIFGV
ncbi:MAG TPA: TatD family hydrolase [Candidatus Saccharimonadales bacterium]|nr:TatD family hydrolase [Candidatus Saccharimonadales bacterium]